LIRYREEILERQYVQERLACVAMELFAGACVLSRWDAELHQHPQAETKNGAAGAEIPALFLRGSFRRIDAWLEGLNDNDDRAVTRVAQQILGEKR